MSFPRCRWNLFRAGPSAPWLSFLSAALLLTVVSVFATNEDASFSPLNAIKHFGSITIADGGSYFTFSKDGAFHSGPLGMSGRELDGHWTARAGETGDATTFTVIAKAGWMNGLEVNDDYRRIVFEIYDVQKRGSNQKPTSFAPAPLFDGYYYIDELVRIPKPPDEKAK